MTDRELQLKLQSKRQGPITVSNPTNENGPPPTPLEQLRTHRPLARAGARPNELEGPVDFDRDPLVEKRVAKREAVGHDVVRGRRQPEPAQRAADRVFEPAFLLGAHA